MHSESNSHSCILLRASSLEKSVKLLAKEKSILKAKLLFRKHPRETSVFSTSGASCLKHHIMKSTLLRPHYSSCLVCILGNSDCHGVGAQVKPERGRSREMISSAALTATDLFASLQNARSVAPQISLQNSAQYQ